MPAKPKSQNGPSEGESQRTAFAAAQETICALARFRYALRGFLHFSETAAQRCGITSQQHQLMLGVASFGTGGTATISELAEFLQEKHHSVIGLVQRAEQNSLVTRRQNPDDRRVVIISLTRHGQQLLLKLTKLHEGQAQKIAAILSSIADGSNQEFQ